MSAVIGDRGGVFPLGIGTAQDTGRGSPSEGRTGRPPTRYLIAGPFPAASGPNRTCDFHRIRLSSDLSVIPS